MSENRLNRLLRHVLRDPVPATNPVMLFKPHGTTEDALDRLNVADSFEDPAVWEKTVRVAHSDAHNEPALANVLASAYLQEDREQAFGTFLATGVPQAIADFMRRFGVTNNGAICDLGCGPGHLAYALHRIGYANVSAMDPNGEWYTGTGHLRSVVGDAVKIISDLVEWRRLSGRFDALVSQATTHHWQHIPLVALDARRTLKPGAFWFAFNEYFANSPLEFVRAINEHPTASRYKSYEWAYPASAYVDLIQSVGFQLVCAVPYYYRNNELLGSMRPLPEGFDLAALNRSVDAAINGTVELFWAEVEHFRRQDHGNRLFTEPQVLVFQRIGV